MWVGDMEKDGFKNEICRIGAEFFIMFLQGGTA
jgi:hypothetical protein